MKNRKIMAALVCAACLAAAAASLYGILADDFTKNDPLVSQSYLEQTFLPRVTALIEEKLAAFTPVAAQPTEPEVQVEPQPTEPVPQAEPVSVSYAVVTMTKGQTLTAAEGSLELILRPGGTAAVVSQQAEIGIADLTNAAELLDGQELPVNAACLIPRADGRGIVCTSDTAYVMVRGSYELQ